MTDTRTVRATGPVDLLALVPGLLGFHPEDSVVLLTVGGARQPFHARVDLPAPAEVDPLSGYLAGVAERSGVGRVALVTYTDDGPLARAVVDALDGDLSAAGIEVVCAVRADGARFWVLDEVGETDGGGYDLSTHALTAQAVLEGTVVLDSRQQLADTLVGRDPRESEDIAARADREIARLARARSAPLGAQQALHRLEGEAHWVEERVRRHLRDGERLGPGDVARLVTVATISVEVRDVAWAAMSRHNAEQHVDLWRDVVRRTPVELRAAPAGLLAFAAWLSGNGALAWCAVECALAAEPGYRMAELLTDLLDGAVPPSQWPGIPRDELRLLAG